MSSKNLLQEYCQKNRLDLPKYTTIRTGGDDHNPVWRAELLFNAKLYSASGTTKREAECKVADFCAKLLINNHNIDSASTQKNKDNQPPKRYQKCDDVLKLNLSTYRKIVLLDAENQDLETKNFYHKEILFLIFVAKNTSKNWVFKMQEEFNNCFVFLSESVGKDAADHLLTFHFGRLSTIISESTESYILTKDHYGEFLQNFFPNTKFICSFDEVKKN